MSETPRPAVPPATSLPRRVVLGLAVTGLIGLGVAPAEASHVTCGQLITENTKLDADLFCESEAALTIAADGVTLDLGGYRVTNFGTETFGGAGVLNDGHDAVTIRNGTIITPRGGPVTIRHADGNWIKGVVVGSGLGPGIAFDDSDGNRVVRSSAGSDDGGVFLRNGSDRNLIERSLLEAGIGVPLSISDSDGNVIRRNSLSGGEHGGLSVGAGSDDNTAQRNEFVGGGYLFPNDNGIYVRAETTNTLLMRNEVRNYRGSGIRVDSPSATLTRNSSNDNGEWGILTVPGVIDGGRNTASGNGVGQCLNISC